MSDLIHDVIIVGGGLVGASLACALSGHGLRLAGIEAATFKRRSKSTYDDRSLSLAWGSRQIFETLGIWQRLGDAPEPIHRIEISQRGRFGRARLDRSDHGVDALGYVVEARILGAAVLDQVESLDDLEMFCPASMEELTVGDDAAEVSVIEGDQTRVLRGRVVVGADGAGSRVRERLGIGARTLDYAQSAVIANVTPEKPHNNCAYERFTDSGPMALLPQPHGRCGVVWTVRKDGMDDILALSDEQFLEQLQRRFGYALGRFERAGRRSAFPLKLVVSNENVRPRAVIIGNAAHNLHPVAGQGFNLGLRDVAVLAEVIVEAHRLGEDPGALDVLKRYGRWRRRDQRGSTLLTDGLVRVFSNDFTPLAAARAAALVGLDLIPGARRAVTRRTMGIAGKLPRLARGVPL
ncbi:MAG: 2-octaprenyl-6-methoxyphenyl hydroxylase [Gammaproteobacteria bacterium]|nr:MAG: 2-octaprenyl-6-methoxyphenyl hydroxylase [Gammaproteobacteria bacterium]